MQKYHMKSQAKNCKRWSTLRELFTEAVDKGMISYLSFEKLATAWIKADTDDTSEFESIKRGFIEALNGKAIWKRK